uniref:hypothetical protein n=1 Tax=Streptococcus pluranimalium TaxID=82348 RepID=UPI003F68C76A
MKNLIELTNKLNKTYWFKAKENNGMILLEANSSAFNITGAIKCLTDDCYRLEWSETVLFQDGSTDDFETEEELLETIRIVDNQLTRVANTVTDLRNSFFID